MNAIILAGAITAFFVFEWLRGKTTDTFNRDCYTLSMGMIMAIGSLSVGALIRDLSEVPLW